MEAEVESGAGLRQPRLAVKRHPYFERRLRRQVVEAQRREQADNTAWYLLGCLCEAVLLGNAAIREAVHATTKTFQFPLLVQPPEGLLAHSKRCKLPRPDDALPAQVLENSGFLCSLHDPT